MEDFDYVELKIPAKSQYVRVVRLSISGLANRIGFLYEDIEDIKIAVSEAVTNVVQHAYKNNEGNIVLGCGVYHDKLEIMVADNGKGFDFQQIKSKIGPYTKDEKVSQLREGGLGLHLMNALMDEVRMCNENGVIIFMTKYVRKEQVESNDKRIST